MTKQRRLLRTIVISGAVLLVVWFFVIAIWGPFGIVGQITRGSAARTEEIPYVGRFVKGLNVRGNVKYVCRTQMHCVDVLFSGTSASDDLASLCSDVEGLRPIGWIGEQDLEVWRATLDQLQADTEEFDIAGVDDLIASGISHIIRYILA